MPKKDFSLIVSIPGEDPARHDLSGDSITFGRGPDNGVQVLVSEVSVQHGAFNATEESYQIVDNGSTNGTQVNGAPVGDGVELSPMDRILLGDTIPVYFVPSAVLDATPVAEVVASIEEKSKEAPAPAPAAAQPTPAAKPAVALPAQTPVAGAQTVKLDQVKPGAPAPGPAKPAPAAPGAAPAAPKLPTAPKLPGPPKTGGAAPAAPSPAAPKPAAPIPLKKPGAPAAPTIPLPKTPPKPGE